MRRPPRAVLASVLLLLASAPTIVVEAAPPAIENGDAPAFAPHPAIIIDGDAAFTLPTSGVRGGSGTPEDPYRIEGWAIVGSTTFGIRLINTTAHVVLKDIYFATEGGQVAYAGLCGQVDPGCPGGSAIRLDNAANVTIDHVGVRFVAIGIHVRISRDISILDSSIGSATDPRPPPQTSHALFVENSQRVRVENVTITRADVALDLRSSENVSVIRTSVSGSVGSIFSELKDITLRSSAFSGNGIALWGRNEDLTVVGSTFNGSYAMIRAGVGVERVSRAFICGNDWAGPRATGVLLNLPPSDNVTLKANVFHDARAGFRMLSSADAVVEYNLVTTSSMTSYGATIGGTGSAHSNAFVVGGLGVGLMGINASDNWWGAADGPSGAGPGTGTRVSLAGAPSIITPFLTMPPMMPADVCPALGPVGASPEPFVVNGIPLP